MTDPGLLTIGWKPFFEEQLTPDERQSAVIARVSAHHGSEATLLGPNGETRVPIQLAESAGLVSPFQDGCLCEVVGQARDFLGATA